MKSLSLNMKLNPLISGWPRVMLLQNMEGSFGQKLRQQGITLRRMLQATSTKQLRTLKDFCG